MRRIRSLKPEILDDAKTARLSNAEWRLFVSGILLADDFGVLRADARQLAASVFWGTNASTCEKELDRLHTLGLWTVYEVDGQQYALINGWAKHQRVDKPNEKRRLPAPSEEFAKVRESVANIPGTFATDRIGRDRKGKEEDEGCRAFRSDVIGHLNRKAGRSYESGSKTSRKFLDPIFAKGFTLEQCKSVIDVKVDEWTGNPKTEKWLRPDTLFRPDNFQRYLDIDVPAATVKPKRREYGVD